MLSKLKNMITWCRISKPGVGVDDYPKQQVEYMGKVAEAVIIYPYGVGANIPADELAVKIAVNGDPENRVVIGCAPSNMPALEVGEVALYHPVSGDIIKMTASGIEITSANVTINSDVAITGDLTVSGKDFITHVHPQGVDSGGDTQVNTGALV